MRVGAFCGFSAITPPEQIAAIGKAVEERGFASIWVPEHVLFFDDYTSQYPYSEDGRITGFRNGMLDPFAALTFLAAHTKRIRLGTAICLVPQRDPIYTAKMVADLDFLSGGRVDFGVGVGWLKEEFDALGIPFAGRGKRTRECLKVMQTLWQDEVSQYRGELYNLPACLQNPKPVQKPHPPIFFGGESEPALKRVAEVGQGWLGANLRPEEMPAKLAQLDKLLANAERSRKDVKIHVMPLKMGCDADAFKRYEDAGVEQVILGVGGKGIDEIRTRLDALAKMSGAIP